MPHPQICPDCRGKMIIPIDIVDIDTDTTLPMEGPIYKRDICPTCNGAGFIYPAPEKTEQERIISDVAKWSLKYVEK